MFLNAYLPECRLEEEIKRKKKGRGRVSCKKTKELNSSLQLWLENLLESEVTIFRYELEMKH